VPGWAAGNERCICLATSCNVVTCLNGHTQGCDTPTILHGPRGGYGTALCLFNTEGGVASQQTRPVRKSRFLIGFLAAKVCRRSLKIRPKQTIAHPQNKYTAAGLVALELH